jgi:DNA-binding CsgD family transcriptional regulator/GAF domain-containing protein
VKLSGRGGAIIAVAPGPAAWRRHEDALAERIKALHGAASQALAGERNVGVLSRIVDGDLAGAVAALAAWCVDHLTYLETSGEDATAELRSILEELRALGSEAAEHDFGLHARRLTDTSAALRRLGATSTSAQLVDHACEQLVHRCGFARAVLSRVDSETWRPWMAHFTGQVADASWFTDWVDRPIPLDDLVLETQVFTEHRPAAVADTGSSRVYRPIIVDAGRSTSYVVAPVVLGDEVVGFFHADHSPAQRRSGLVDRDVLWTFAQGFSLAYERLMLAERLQAQRERIHKVLGSAEALLSLPNPALELALMPGESNPLPAGRPAMNDAGAASRLPHEELTDREGDVLRLLAVGATNAQIADQLVVSESTVKSHVRHILRKLGAVNRAQAISRYLGVAPLEGRPASDS